MKLESIKKAKFSDFTKSKLLTSMNVVGGRRLDTKKVSGGPVTDCWDDATGDDIHCDSGNSYDACDAAPGYSA